MKKIFFLTAFIVMNIVIFSQDNKSIQTTGGSYLGQKQPGTTPEVFAPGIVSTKEYFEIGCTWSPDGKEFYFVRQSDKGGQVLCSKLTETGWTKPEEVEYFKKYPGFEPFISPDGKKLFYTRFAPVPGGDPNPSPNIWAAEKDGMKFSEPVPAVPGMFNSVSSNGNLYVTDVPGNPDRICMYRNVNGKYDKKEYLTGGVNSPVPGAHPCIAPDESFIIFDSKRKDNPEDADLYVCFKLKNGNWSEAINLGDEVNTKWNDICPSLSPDGKFLFYMSKMDIYWVSTKIIEELKPKE